jgi:2-amino-4-hydroxy-6-hydroxymethyldihydropteridine diphosphokinase
VILIGIGGNLASLHYGQPQDVLAAALVQLQEEGITVTARSAWYRTEPVPRSTQPWFVNAAAVLATDHDSRGLLARLQALETRFGRTRGEPNAARLLDLDLLDCRGQVINTPSLVLPHPRLHERRFVLVPLVEIAPNWRHPVLGLTAEQLLAQLASQDVVERLPC